MSPRSSCAVLADTTRMAARARASSLQFSGCLEFLQKTVQALRENDLQPSPHSAGWYHSYFCPEHGYPLNFDPRSPTEHRCPAGGEHVLVGPRFDGGWRWFVNDRLSRAAYGAALLWVVTDAEPERDYARQVLSAYAARYTGYPIRSAAKAGRATVQSLDEAVWIIPLLWAYDLIRDSLTREEATYIEDALLLPARDHIASKCFDIVHNIECWHQAALLTAGVVLRRQDWIADATQAVRQQLDHGVLDDGMWCEGSPSYHYYATWALMWAARVSDEVRGHPKLVRMLRAPLDLAYPDGSLPALNDCWFHSSLEGELVHGAPPVEGFYEIAAGWFDHPAFTELLAVTYEKRPRLSAEALLYGPERLRPKRNQSRWAKSRVFPASGCAVLGTGQSPADSVQLVFKYGSHGGQHGHPDKLSFALWGFGQPISQDLGTGGYGDEEGTAWYRSTLAHNTVVVDGQTQPPATGRLREYRGSDEGAFGVLDAEVEWKEGSYRGVRIRRVLLHRLDTIIDIVDCQADVPRRFELAQRFRGPLLGEADRGEPVILGGLLRNFHRLASPHGQRLEIGTAPSLLTDYCALEQGSECFVGEAPANPRTSFDTLLLRRRDGSSKARFISVIHLRRPEVASIRARIRTAPEDAETIELSFPILTESWTVALHPRLKVERSSKSSSGGRDHGRSVSAGFSSQGQPLVAFLPAAHGSRQYVGLLREGLERVGVEVRDLPRLPSADWVREHAGPSTVMHLHMPAYDYSKGTANREEVLRRLQIWEAGIGQARASGCGLVWTAHNLYPHDSPHRDLHHRARVTLLKHATAVIAHCRRGTEEVQRNFGGAADITVIPHPHYRESYDLWSRDEARQALDLPPDALVYLNLGMIRPYKGQERLLRAFSSLQDPSARLVIAGAAFGASGEAGEDLVGRLRGAATLDPRVIIRPDRVPDSLVPAYFAACDFAVFAYTEVLTSGGIALAQTMERPVIAPAIGCIPEMVPEGTGIVYEPGTTAALEAALRRARSLPASAGARAWESIRPFDWMTTAVATREVYRKAIRISADGLRARPPELRP